MRQHEVDDLVGDDVADAHEKAMPHESAMVRRDKSKRPGEPALTPNQLAWRYGVGVHKVLTWIKRGELRAVNVASDLSKRPQWVITADALAAFEAGRANQATPRARRRRKCHPIVKEFF